VIRSCGFVWSHGHHVDNQPMRRTDRDCVVYGVYN
jgi:hypothetical protein